MNRQGGPLSKSDKRAIMRKKLAAWITLLTFLGQPALAAAQAVADPNAPAQNRPSVTNAQNGVPVVQITAPSAAGVSRNLYQDFSVDQQGLILNNSRVLVQTQLGGYIIGNPNLVGGSARVILNEVTGTNASQLRGYLEVAGQRAEVVVANPNGITVNGGGFINTSRAILTTGTPLFGGSGSLDAFRVTGGQIAIEGIGLDASTADRADLLSRVIQVNAGIWAKELNVVTGANKVDYNTLNAEKIAGIGSTPQVSLDVAALGGMYANKIKLVGTEAGVGVNSLGTISANGGDLVLTNEGKITLAGGTSAGGNININANDDVTNQGTLYAQGNTAITAAGTVANAGVLAAAQNTTVTAQTVSSAGTVGAGVNNDGTVGNSGDLAVTASGTVTATGQNLAGGNLTVTGASVGQSGAITSAGGNAAITATAGDIDHTGGNLQAGGALTINAAGAVKNDKNMAGTAGLMQANKVAITAGDINNRGGSIRQTGTDATSLTATNTVDNTGGSIATNGASLTVQGAAVTNSGGQIQHAGTDTLTVKATSGDLNNDGGIIATNGQASIQGQNITSTQGVIAAQKQIAVSAAALTNDNGTIASNTDAINIRATGGISNQQGTIQAQKGLDINAQSLTNQGGRIVSLDASGTTVAASEAIQNQSGLIGGNGAVNISAKSVTNTDGSVLAQGNLNVTAAEGVDNTRGTMSAGQNLTLTQSAANLTNSQGNIGAGNNLAVKAAVVDNTGGKVATDTDMALTVSGFTGAGQVSAGQNLTLTATGDFTNDAGNKIKANNDLTFTIGGLATNAGSLEAGRNLTVLGGNVTNGATGLLAANQTLTVNLTRDFDNSGSVFGKDITLQANRIGNAGGTAAIAGTGNMKLFAATSLENKDDATIYSFGNIDIAADAAKDGAGNYLNKTGSVLNQSAIIEANGDIVINANTLTNKMASYTVTRRPISSTSYTQRGFYGSSVDPTLYAVVWEGMSRPSAVALTPVNNSDQVPVLWLIGETVADTTVTPTSAAARLAAGHDMKIDAGTITNENSMLLAAGTLTTPVGATINDISTGNQHVSTRTILYGDSYWAFIGTIEVGTSYYGWGPNYSIDANRQFNTFGAMFIGRLYNDNVATQLAGGLTSIIGGGKSVNIQGTTVNNVVVAPGSVAGTPQTLLASAQAGAVSRPQTTGGANITLPANGMFAVNTAPTARYLVETNPRFASYQNFVSSDYMLGKLGIDPASTIKRLGDGFYEQRIVRDQVTSLTGRAYLSTFGSAEAQYKALLDNGSMFAQKYNLTVGVALTPEQMANLTADMVWLVEQEVQGQKVLVPVVYLAQMRDGDLTAEGAVIAADEVQIKTSGDLNNAGVIKATGGIDIAAANVANTGGTIEGSAVRVSAVQDLTNASGTIQGDQVNLTAGRSVKIETASSTATLPFMTRTTTGNAATVSAGQSLTVQAGGDVSIAGAKISAGQDASVSAGGSLSIDSVSQQERVAVGYYLKDNVVNAVTSIQSGGNTTLAAQGDMRFKGAQVAAGNELNLTTGGNVSVAAVKDSAASDVTYGSRAASYTRTMTSDETVIGGSLTAKNNVNVTSGASVTLEGSQAVSDMGKVAIAAAKDVAIKEITEKHETLNESRKIDSGFFSTKVTETRDYNAVNLVKGSTVSGNTVDVNAGRDLTVKGSSVVGTGDVKLTAQGNASITTAQETGAEEHYRFEKESGIFGSGFGITIGSRSEKDTLAGQTVAQVGSTVGSTTGNVDIAAGKDAAITGSDVISGNDATVTAQNIDINAATNASQAKETYEFKQSGLTVSLGGGIVTSGSNLAFDVRRAGDVSDNRLKALYEYKALQELNALNKDLSQKTPLTVSVSLGSSRYSSETVTTSTSAQGSNLTAGGDVNITATGSGAKDAAGRAADGSVNIAGSGVNGQNVNVTAAKDINLTAGYNNSASNATTSSSSAGVGVSMGGKTGVFVEGSRASGNEDESGTTHTQTLVAASDTLTTTSGSDTHIVGGQAQGGAVNMTVGGNLNIGSPQDSESYSARTSSAGGTIGIGPNISSSLSASKDKTDSTYTSVTQQSGVQAGQGGFNINVGGNTDLQGAVIASDATPDKNKLSTGTLTWSDIQNKAEYSASSSGIGVGWGGTTKTMKDGKVVEVANDKVGITPNIGVPASGEASSTTKSAIALGTIEVRSNPHADLSRLSRDISGALNALGKIFDKKTVQERQELAQVFGEVAFKEAGKIIENQFLDALKKGDEETAKKWMPGGEYQVALHTVLAGIMADMGGSNFASGASGAALDAIVQSNLRNVSPAGRQFISVIVGSAAGRVAGGSAQTGAATAGSAIQNNDFSDKLSGAWNALKDKGTGTLDGVKQLVTNPSIFFDAVAAVCKDPTLLISSFVGDIPENYYKLKEAVANGDDYAAGYYATALLYGVTLDAGQVAGAVKATSTLGRIVQISKAEASIVTITNDILGKPRAGSALKLDSYHAFSDIVDNYAGLATKTSLERGAVLYQVEGSLNGVAGRFEWITQDGNVTHRMFVPGGTLNGVPIQP